MDIYCATCGEPYELYIGDDADRLLIDSVKRGMCPACKGVKPPTCHDCGFVHQEVAGDCPDCGDARLLCNDCWGRHDSGDHVQPDQSKVKLSRAEASSVLYDLFGDDLDGVASMMDDAEYMGLV